MRQFNTTAVNLRAALDDLDPLVEASKPVARKLQPVHRGACAASPRDAVPTVRDLDGIVRRRGAANDLIELTRLQVPLARDRGRPGQPQRRLAARGALPASADSLERLARPSSRFFRAYTPELVGWFDDFGHSGFPDAIGGIGRISTTLNTFSVGAPGRRAPLRQPPESSTPPLGTSRLPVGSASDLLNGLGTKNCSAARAPTSATRATARRSPTAATVDCDPNQTRPAHEAARS